MQRFRWIALQGSSRGLLPPLLLFVFLITTSGIPAFAADVSAACSSPVARVVSIQGSIEVLRAGQNDWGTVTRLDTLLCDGDRLRTGVLSRAALFIQPETLVRVDQNTNISVSQNAQETLIEFRQEDVLPAAASAYSCGAGYFITRFPRKFRVKTPHLNAAVEGTEFLVAMRCESTELSVFEGKVLAASTGANIFPAQSISSGQMLTIGGSEPPTVKLLVKPTDAVQWVVYYPPLSDATAEGDLPTADQCRSLPKALDQTCLTQRAEALLRLGRVDEAQREIDEAVALDPGSGDANALRAIISIARNEKAGAMEAATAATTASPNASRAWLALSYAQQASFKLEDSLSSARKAQTLEPNSSVTNARVAELLMSLGRIKEAEVAARAAVDANPSESRAHTVLGFVHLAQIKTKAARADFVAAIERDSSDPLPRLGLGLAIIRDGKLADGREQLEIAVALDPTNSLLRSYVGKAYYEENTKDRDQLAVTQFDLAKQLDPNDPTPWFYEAILKQTQNRPIEALENLQQSTNLNDNREVYRSTFLLDEDRAARASNTTELYSTLGFNERALVDATTALSDDLTSFSAHSSLSDQYGIIPRQQTARESEILQSQLRAPVAHIPLMPLRARNSLFAGLIPKGGYAAGLRGVSVAANEYAPLFEREGARGYVDVLVGDYSTVADRVAATGLLGNVAISAAQGHYENGDGIVPGKEIREDAYEALLTAQLNERIWLHASGYSSRTDRSDVSDAFDPDDALPFDVHEEYARARLGLRIRPTPGSEALLYVSHEALSLDFYMPTFDFGDRLEKSSTTVEMQLSFPGRIFSTTVGAAHARASTMFGLGTDPIDSTHDNGYVYGTLKMLPALLQLEGGISYDRADATEEAFLRSEYNPKLGLVLTPLPGFKIRTATTQTVRREIAAETTLEPTQVAGFNQFYDDPAGAVARTKGIGVDVQASRTSFVGAEYVRRDIDAPLRFTNGFTDFDWQEWWTKAYWYLGIPSEKFGNRLSLALTAEYWQISFRRPDDLTDLNDVKHLDTTRIPLGFRVFTGATRATITASYFKQTGSLLASAGNDEVSFTENFWSVDLVFSREFPRRSGYFELGAANVFDEQARYQEIDPSLPQFSPKRLIFARAAFRF